MNHSSNPRGLSVEWTKGLVGDEKDKFEDLVRNSTTLLTRLERIINDKLDVLDRKETSEDFHDSAGYPFNQAFVNGRRAELESILQLLQFLNR